MDLLLRRKDWEWLKEIGKAPPAEKVIQALVNFLIASLFRPDPELVFRVDGARVDQLVGDPGPVNYGDLCCWRVEERDGLYVAHVGEADPGAYGLQRYLENWLRRWGWSVLVKTDW